jgi:hypothetical protein
MMWQMLTVIITAMISFGVTIGVAYGHVKPEIDSKIEKTAKWMATVSSDTAAQMYGAHIINAYNGDAIKRDVASVTKEVDLWKPRIQEIEDVLGQSYVRDLIANKATLRQLIGTATTPKWMSLYGPLLNLAPSKVIEGGDVRSFNTEIAK